MIETARTILNGSSLPKQFWGEAVNTASYTQSRSIIVKRHGKTSYDVFSRRSLDISYFHVFGYPVFIHNHRDHLGKFDEKVDDGSFLGYSLVAKDFRVFNIRRQELEEIFHVTFNEANEAIRHTNTKGANINFTCCYPKNDREDIGKLGAKVMHFEQRSSKPKLQGRTSGHISLGLDLTYAPSTITPHKPTKRDSELLFELMYDDCMGGQPSDAKRTAHVASATLNHLTPNASTTTAETAPTPSNSSTEAPIFPNTSQDVDEL
ncbi:retrovirus-related pol polyprotein from transposon TNT 1-94 [Tanacetum coccineum]